LFCLTDRENVAIPDELDISKIIENLLPDFTTPSSFTTPDYFTTPFPIPDWPKRFDQADYTYTVMSLYVGFNAAWAVTCLIAVGKWKERAVEDSC
jgi:hypothetical protein